MNRLARGTRGALAVAMVAACVTLTAGCPGNPPPSLSPEGVKYWKANEAAVHIGTLQRAAIGLNGVQRCDAAGTNCSPVLSNANTRRVIDAVEVALKTLRAAPEGWRPATNAALDAIEQQLDNAGLLTLKIYIQSARQLLDALAAGEGQ